MNYTLHQLNIFLEISRTKSITQTAEKLFLTQPAVSIQLKKFQEQFSIPLTELVGRQLYITDFGYEIAAAASKIINEVHAINYKTLAHAGKLTGKLKISVASTGKYVMPYFLSGFLQQHPGIDLVMDVTNKTKVVRSMELNQVDFSLVSTLPDKLSLHSIKLMPNQLYLVGNQQIEINSNAPLKESLKAHTLIHREPGSATRDAMDVFLKQHDYVVAKKLELTSNEAVKQAVIAGLGLSIMPLIGIKNELQNRELQIIPIQGLPITTQWRLIYRKAKKLSPGAQAFLEFIELEHKQIIENKFAWIKDYAIADVNKY
jgi:DNA-binding transcriptional LysR family regulator